MKKLITLTLALALAATMFVGCDSKPLTNTSSTASATDGGNSGVVIATAADLDGLKIGCQSGTTGEAWVLENCLKKEPKGYKSGMDAAMDLKNGNIDAIVLDELPAKSIVDKNKELKILDIKFSKEEYAIAVSKGNTELVESINATIKAMKDDGTYKGLTDSFMPADGNIVVPEEVLSDGAKELKMGTNAAFPPFEYVDNQKIVGFDVSMSQHVAKGYGATLKVVDMEFDSLIGALKAGTIDMIAAGMSVNEDRLKNVDFSDPYYESEQVIIVKK